jgi:phosphotransferase family enzyme
VTRTVSLILVDPAGDLLGALPDFTVGTPWWPEVQEIANDRRQVLRLLAGDRPAPPGGHVTYLAETDERPAGLRAVEVDLAPHPLRAPYAEVGGPATSIAWATGLLTGRVTVKQQRTWNLSAVWRLDDPAGRPVAWLKQVPAFFAHEPAALRLVGAVSPGLVPALLADGPQGRMLLAHAPGEDRYAAGADVCAAIGQAFHPVQAYFAENLDELDGVVPDRRLDAGHFARVAEPYYDRIDGLQTLIDGLPERFRAIAECGLPDTLVHGDLHPGNVRTDPAGRLTILDWGDCSIGHPGFDILRLTGGLDDPEPVLTAWAYRWKKTLPGSEPQRAAELLRPVAALHAAAAYAAFLDAIEPSEWPYHARDVPACLAASIVGG